MVQSRRWALGLEEIHKFRPPLNDRVLKSIKKAINNWNQKRESLFAIKGYEKISWQSRVDHCACAASIKILAIVFDLIFWIMKTRGRLTYTMKSSQSKPQQLDQDMPTLHALLARNRGGFQKNFEKKSWNGSWNPYEKKRRMMVKYNN